MATTDINAQHVLVISESSSELLAGWGKTILSSLNLAHATELLKTNHGYELLVDNRRVQIELCEDQHADTPHNASDTQLVTVAERLDLIKGRLGLSITQLAELFDVTRKTVYDWYEGTEPRRNAVNRIEILIEVLNKASPEIDLVRLKAVWNISVFGKSFLAVLGEDNLDAGTLQNALLEKLNELSSRMVATTGRMRKTNLQFGEAQLAEFERRIDHS
jgi:DNA-binding transcriptional regulator YiaG